VAIDHTVIFQSYLTGILVAHGHGCNTNN